jgi:predicted O-methyltransferase YrrM
VTQIRPGMGTENSASVLAALVRMQRPVTVVEVGAGDSTIALATALQQTVEDWQEDETILRSTAWTERTALLDPTNVPERYAPTLITIDDFSGEGTSASAAWSALKKAGVPDGLVRFVRQDFFTIPSATMDEWYPIDLAWVDAGTPADDVRFIAALWDRIRPGGYLCLHEPTMLTTGQVAGRDRLRVVRNPVWEEILSRLDDTFEVVTLAEPHKYRQSGLGIIRKRTSAEGYIRRSSLQQELFALGGVPLRNDLLPIGTTRRERAGADAVANTLKDDEQRRVYAAIILDHRSLGGVAVATGLPLKTVGKAVSRLMKAGLIDVDGRRLIQNTDFWKNLDPGHPRDGANFSDSRLEEPTALTRIAEIFAEERDYSEAEVSTLCSLFTNDFARLRRRLVDEGLLTRRSGNLYSRSAHTR